MVRMGCGQVLESFEESEYFKEYGIPSHVPFSAIVKS